MFTESENDLIMDKNTKKSKRLYEVLEENVLNPKYPLHMPGHKRSFWEFNFEDFDFTEIAGLDNLQNPTECLDVTQKAIANLFQSDESLILVNGSTVGILASILGSVTENDTVAIGRNCHQSVINAVYMAKCKHVFINPQFSKYGIVTGFSVKNIESTLKSNENINVLVLTSPTYEGIVLDVKAISVVCKKYDVTLIIDEAHGAYFIDENLPTSAVVLGADVVIQSLHKTLPSPTQTALLHINKSCTTSDSIKRYLTMLQTTSPSYFFMYCIDKLVENIENNNLTPLFKRHYNRIKMFRENCNKLLSYGVLELIDNSFVKSNNVFDLDIYKLTFIVKKGNGVKISNILRDKYMIELEMATDTHFIAMTSIADCDEIFDVFLNALIEISESYSSYCTREFFEISYNQNRKTIKQSNVDINLTQLIKLSECVGMVCAKNITPYPPCIPLVVIGEFFESSDIEVINRLVYNGVNMLGIDIVDGEVYVCVQMNTSKL